MNTSGMLIELRELRSENKELRKRLSEIELEMVKLRRAFGEMHAGIMKL